MPSDSDPCRTDTHNHQYDRPLNIDVHHHFILLCGQSQRCNHHTMQPGVYVANPEPNLEDIDNKSE
jgi:hypothetical protein